MSRRLTLRREALTALTPAELESAVAAGTGNTRNILCIASGARTCEGQELTDTCPVVAGG